MQNTRCDWAAGLRRSSLGLYILPLNQSSAPVVPQMQNEGHFILWDRQEGSSGIFSAFSLLDFSDEIKPLPANSQCTPHSYLDYQVFSSSLSKSYLPWRLSQLSSTGDLMLQLLGGRLFPFGGGRNSPCCPFHAPWGLIPFSHGFVPPLSVPTQGRTRWGTKFHNTCPPCRQYTQLQGMSHAREPPLPPHIQL